MYISIFIIQILQVVLANLDCSTIKGTALNSYAYKTDVSVQFDFTISSNGNVDLIFPSIWRGSPSISPLISGTTTCKETSLNIVCTQVNQNFVCPLQAGKLTIRCQNLRGPHTNKPIGNFNIQFDTQLCENILISDFQTYGGSLMFSTNSTTGLLPNSDNLQMIWDNIVLPISFATNPIIEVSILANAEFVQTSPVKGYVSSIAIGLLEQLTVSTSSLIKAQMPQQIAQKDVSIKLYIEFLKLMGNTQPIQSQIDFKDSNDVLQYQILSPTILVQNDQLSATLTIDSTEINIYTKYTFGLTIKNKLDPTGFVRIPLPKTLLSSTLICYCDNIVAIPIIMQDYIDIGGCFTTIGLHYVAIQNVLNPASTISTISIPYIQTMQNGYSVDRMTNFQYTTPSFTPGSLSVQYERQGNNLDIVGDYSYFTLKITPKNKIPAYGILKMEIPQEIVFVNQNTQTCDTDGYGCQIQTISDQILVFNFSSPIQASTLFTISTISIPIRNPFDTSKTNYFKFTTYDQLHNIIDTINNIQGYSVNTRSKFDGSVIIESDHPFKNGQSNNFVFTIKTKTPQFYPILMTIQVGDLTINNNPQCKLEGAVINKCTKVSSNQLDVLIESTDSILLPTTLKLTVSTIKCKDTMTKSQDFVFSTKSTNGLMSYQLGPSISNTQIGDIVQTELIVDKQYYGATNAVYQFNFALQNPLSDDIYQIKIFFPFNLPSSSYSCKYTSNNKLDCSVEQSTILILSGPFDSNQLIYNIIVSGMPTPSNEQQPRTFTIKTYRKIDDSNYLVDSSVNGAFQFNVLCPQLNNCKTCKLIATDNVQCETCYTSLISKYIYMKQTICVNNCGVGYYQNEVSYICQICPQNCQSCQPKDEVLFCDKCFDNFKYQDSICVDNCGDTYYLPIASSDKCEKCDEECIICSKNSSYCSKCQPSIPLYDNKCYKDGCLDGYYKTYNSKKVLVCELCPASCMSCIQQDLCTECQQGQYYLQGQCRTDCPSSYFVDEEQMKCKSCIPGCSQCLDDSTCISCSEGFLLKQQQCVLTCGEQYYVDIEQTTCLKCDQNCKTCELKEEKYICTNCIQSYFLYDYTCIKQCDINQYAVNQECFQCSQNCLTCKGSSQTCVTCYSQGNTPLYLDGTICVSKCQDAYFPDLTSGSCKQCPSACTKCTSLTNCTQCNQSSNPYYLIEGICKEECPQNYQPKGLLCQLIPEEIIINLGPNQYVPVPHVILFTFLTISVLVSKQYKSETYVPGSILGLNAPLIWSSWLTVLFLLHDYYDYNNMYYFWILIWGVILNLLFNICHFILVTKKIWNDLDFIRWQASSFKNKLSNYILISFSILFAYPIYKLIMSRYFGLSFFKAKMIDIKPFFSFNCLNGMYIIFVNIPIILSCVLIAYNQSSLKRQIFISAIDSLIITFSNILFLIWETQKGEQFFDEFISNYYLNESNQHFDKQENSCYFQNTQNQIVQVEQKMYNSDLEPIIVNQQNDIVKQKSQEKVSHLEGMSIILSDKNSNPIFKQDSLNSQQFPLKQIVPSNLKHTVYYMNVKNNQNDNPDDEPPQISPRSECSNSQKSQAIYQQRNSIDNQSKGHFLDQPPQNSQLSIFDEEQSKDLSKEQHENQQYQNERNNQQINLQVEKTQNSFIKNGSQQSINQKEINSSQNSSNRENQVYNQQITKSALFTDEQIKKIQTQESISRNSSRIQTNQVQEVQLRQQVVNQEQPITQQFVNQQKKIEQSENNNTINEFDQIHNQILDDYYSISSNRFQTKQKSQDKSSFDNLQLQISITDEQPQFDTEQPKEENNTQIINNNGKIERQELQIFQDQIQIQQIQPIQLEVQQQRVRSDLIKQVSQIKNLFDQNDSIHSMTDQDWREDQRSPSEFYSLNNKFKDQNGQQQFQISVATHNKRQQYYKQAKVLPIDYEIEDGNNDEKLNVQVDISQSFQVKKEIKKQEQVCTQKIEKIEKRSSKMEFKRKKVNKKDMSDVYVDDIKF